MDKDRRQGAIAWLRNASKPALALSIAAAASSLFLRPLTAFADSVQKTDLGARLAAAYPGIVLGVEGNDVLFKDGTKIPFDDGRSTKSFEDWLNDPDVEDMFRIDYHPDSNAPPPPKDSDPGRARNEPFFRKVYGDCKAGGVASDLVDIVWLPKRYGRRIRVTRINGVARRLQAVSNELDRLPRAMGIYLYPPGGTYNCRNIAGTNNRSAHGYGIAIDIATAHAHYWRSARADARGGYEYQNAIPAEIVPIFEKHGFIWGGRWYHYDTMHFEYRPELLPPSEPISGPVGSAPIDATAVKKN